MNHTSAEPEPTGTGGLPDRYAVVGHPIAHSRSPFIHARFAAQTGERMTYGAMDVPPETFRERVDAFRADGGRGLNVTVPLKEIAFRYAGHVSDRARRAGAVNTLRFEPGSATFGDNTDGVGLVRDLTVNLGVSLVGQRILLIGAGGAARGVLGPLLDAGPAQVVVANRTPSRARALAAVFEDQGPVHACGLDAVPGERFQLVINATAAGLAADGAVPLAAEHLAADALCYDMVYGSAPTAFMRRAAALGAARTADGRGMLVEQAAESFALWRGVRPRTGPVIAALDEALAAG